MNCREFRRKHDAYIDDTLSGVELDGMATHRRVCDTCSKLDTRVRRALLLARNLPTIHPSADFGTRLQARLDAERPSLELYRQAGMPKLATRSWHPSMGTYGLLTAGVLVAAGVAGAALQLSPRHDIIRLAPVVATRSELEPAALSAPTMVAAMPAGMPVWSAVFVAQQAPWHFASDAIAP